MNENHISSGRTPGRASLTADQRKRLIKRLADDLALSQVIAQWSQQAQQEIARDLRRRNVLAVPYGEEWQP